MKTKKAFRKIIDFRIDLLSLFIISLFMTFLFMSCQDEEVVPLNTPQNASEAISNEHNQEWDAKTLASNHRAQPFVQPLAFPFFNPCTNEIVDWSAIIRGVIHEHFDAQGKRHYQYNLRVTKAKGVGLESGMNYVATGMFDFVIHTNESNAGSTYTEQIHQSFISKGPGPNAVLTYFLHMTINANGELASFREDPQQITCK